MPDLAYGGLPFCRKPRHDQRRPAPKIGSRYRCAVELLCAFDQRHSALQLDVGAHPGQLGGVLIPALEDILDKDAGSVRQGR